MNSIRNFRDLGNIPSRYGKIKMRKILRGGPLNTLSDEDKVNLCNHHHLSALVDFRNTHEIYHEPNVALEGVQTYNIHVVSDEDRKVEETKNNIATSADFMLDIYQAFVLHPQARKTYREFLEIVADHAQEGSIYFHCTAGKDRTGFAAAILLKILGVSDEEIFKDYLKTNDNIEKDKASLMASIQEFHPFDDQDNELLYDVLGVKEIYLKTSFDVLEKEYGSFDNYLKTGLELNSETIKRLRDNLITGES